MPSTTLLFSVLPALPFFILLVLIATGPVFFQPFWHRHYKTFAVCIGLFVIAVYLFRKNPFSVEQASLEYFSFISLLAALYVASGGICIEADIRATPFTNVLLLLLGALLSNVIGTTGAAILLIRPFLRINEQRMKPYLVIFFIFIVCNIGGSLTPMGPPLFLGFLRGIPFEWTFNHLLVEWVFAIVFLLILFFIFDLLNAQPPDTSKTFSRKIKITGSRNLIWLAIIVGTVFLEPAKVKWLPSIDGHSFVREILQLAIAFVCYRTSNKKALSQNRFGFEPILEVAFLFFGIFMSMIPALEVLNDAVHSLKEGTHLSPSFFYWGTGSASAFLDNAPSYITFLATAMSYFGMNVNDSLQVYGFSQNGDFSIYLQAISIASVFFGALTYIGNGPNFMVKAIAEDLHIKMPSFFAYMIRFSLPILLPLLLLIWWLFFR